MKSYDYPRLVVKRLMGTISLEESEALNKWLMADRENRRIYMDIKRSLQENAPPETPEAQELLMRKSAYFSARGTSRKDPSSKKKPGRSVGKRILNLLLPGQRVRPTYRAFLIVILAIMMIHIYHGRISQKKTVEIETAANERRELTLGEGSEVLLGKRSRLQYSPQFSDTLRVVYLQGEAKFRVAPDSTRPFLVVAGPAFAMTTSATFYLRSLDTLTVLQVGEGKVSFQYGDAPANGAVLLTAGKMLSVRPHARQPQVQPFDPSVPSRWWP